MNAREKMTEAKRLLMEVKNSGYWPFASPAPCSTERKIKEKIVMQMHSQPGASNLTPRVLSQQEMVDNNDTPFERLKAEVRKAVVEQ